MVKELIVEPGTRKGIPVPPFKDFSLLSTSNAKIEKSKEYGWESYILHLTPFTDNSKGINICPGASSECVSFCLNLSGRGKFSTVQSSRRYKTELFLANRELFLEKLWAELALIEVRRKLYKLQISIRLNGTSDLVYEKYKFRGQTVFEAFPNLRFIDYTKVFNRLERCKDIPNYHLTFSYSGENWLGCEAALAMGVNAAVVFKEELPETYRGYPVIDGTLHDLRFLDPSPVVVGLIYKKADVDRSIAAIDQEATTGQFIN